MSDSAGRENGAACSADGDPFDLLPYESRPYPDTQPGRLSALAVLHGLEPAEVTRGRVLELGCASGGNILPLAVCFPEASFIGINLWARHVEEGRARIRELGLANIELRQGDLANCNLPSGTFDTIICHGVYSWVPPDVQDAILRIVATQLAPTGLAYISYNTYPGWHLRQTVRDIFRYHAGTLATPQQQVAKGLALLEELAQSTDATRPYGQALRAEAKLLAETTPSYIMGEYLAASSTPCYFHEFSARVSAHGLAYLCEARFDIGLIEELHPDFDRKIRAHAGDDPVAHEQYLDLFLGRQFRRSVLVKADHTASITRTISKARLSGLHLATTLEPDLEESSYGKIVFKNSDERTLTAIDPDVCRALELLATVAPRTLTPEEICAKVIPAGVLDRAPREGRVIEALLHMVRADFGTASTSAVRADEASALMPRAWKLARCDAANRRPWTTNLGHRIVRLDDLTCWLLQRLDGSTDRLELAKQLIAAVQIGEISGSEVVTTNRSAPLMTEADEVINRLVAFCAKNALLESKEPERDCHS